MQSAKQKVSDMASAAKEKIQIAKAKVEEEVLVDLLLLNFHNFYKKSY